MISDEKQLQFHQGNLRICCESLHENKIGVALQLTQKSYTGIGLTLTRPIAVQHHPFQDPCTIQTLHEHRIPILATQSHGVEVEPCFQVVRIVDPVRSYALQGLFSSPAIGLCKARTELVVHLGG